MDAPSALTRRSLLAGGVSAAGLLALGPAMWRALAATTAGPGPYGALTASNVPGIQVAEGFAVRQVARGGQPPTGSGYVWHNASDGAATYRTSDGGWILVSNSEASAGNGGGSSALRFTYNGNVRSAYRILGGTSNNCAGGPTPWGTWLSCEEIENGQVWESDPAGLLRAQARPALGAAYHEAVCVDPVGQRLYLSEDRTDGGFYRFTPTTYPDLTTGLLEVAIRNSTTGVVSWVQVPDPSGTTQFTRFQVPGMTQFRRGEGLWFDRGKVYLATTSDARVWSYDPVTGVMDVLYDGAATPGSALTNIDNVTASPFGDIYVCEDPGTRDVCVISIDKLEVAPFLRFSGSEHSGSEATGVVFDPSGTRMYVSSQRAGSVGAVYEVSGPFRLPAQQAAARSASVSRSASRSSTARSTSRIAAPGLAAGEIRPDGPLNPGGPLPPRSALPADSRPPGLRVSAPRNVARADLNEGELEVSVSLKRAAAVTVVLRTTALARRRNERGQLVAASTDLVLVRRSLARGTNSFSLRPRGKGRSLLAREARSVPATILVQAVHRGRQVTVATRAIRIGAGR